jgi:hypothetical protein
MEMGIVVTAFYLFGMLGLVIFNEAIADEPTQAHPRLVKSMAKPKSRVRTAHHAADSARTPRKAA